jgi:hypothetical protein
LSITTERILKRSKKALGLLRERDLGVGLAAATEHDAEEVGLPPLPVHTDDPGPCSVVNLALRPRQRLHATERKLHVAAKLPDIALDRVITALEPLFYFGTVSGSPTFMGNQTGTTFDPGTLTNKVKYYWRIDEVNATGTTTGTQWYFTVVR